MAIPKFFRALYRLIGQNRVTINKLTRRTNALFFDLASLLHSIAQRVYAYGDHATKSEREEAQQLSADKLREKYYTELFAELRSIITAANPRLVGIFFDGVPVMAKIEQQRMRRFWATQERIIAATGEKATVSLFDSNNITVGTAFLKEVGEAVEKWIKDNREELPEIVVYSSPYSPGEGEHKIMDFIRQQIKIGDGALVADELGDTVIYGLDTDWLMLTLLLPLENVYLWRSFGPGFPPYFDVNAARQLIAARMLGAAPAASEPITTKKQQQLLRDFVVFTFLLGNDFLPRNPTLENFDYSLERLVKIYAEFQAETPKARPLTSSKRIIWSHTLQYIKRVAAVVPEFLTNILEVSASQKDTNKENVALKASIKRKGDDLILNYPLYATTYYEHRLEMEREFGGLSDDVNLKSFRKAVTKSYLTTLSFSYDYYRKGSEGVNKKYYYPFHYCPLLSDLVNLGASQITDIVENREWTPSSGEDDGTDDFVHPLRLLVAVLPRKSFNLIPQVIRNQVEEKILADSQWALLYPTKAVIKDVDAVLYPDHAPVIIPFFPPRLLRKIKVPPKSQGNLEDEWEVLQRPERKKKTKKHATEKQKGEEVLF